MIEMAMGTGKAIGENLVKNGAFNPFWRLDAHDLLAGLHA
jgi:hypothetical protein